MTDQVPGQQGEQTPPGQPDVDWEARYKGLSTKYNQLQQTLNGVQQQLSQLTSEKEHLAAQLTQKDVEKDASTTAYKTQLDAATKAKTDAEAELVALRALQKKVALANKLGASKLLPVLDRIPTVPDETAQEAILKEFMDWGNKLAGDREQQILAGTTATVTAPPKEKAPSTAEEWTAQIFATPPGPDRQALEQKFFEWGRNQK